LAETKHKKTAPGDDDVSKLISTNIQFHQVNSTISYAN